MESLQDLGNIPMTGAARGQTLQGLATRDPRRRARRSSSHYNVSPVIDIYGAVQGRDLGGVSREIDPDPRGGPKGTAARIADHRARPDRHDDDRPSSVCWRAWRWPIVLVYLLIVVNFQSWLDPFIIISALPAALAGIVWFLFLSHTTFSVPVADRRHHVHGCRDGEQHPRRQLRERTARRAARARSRPRSKPGSRAFVPC